MESETGSTRALACADRRPAGRNESVIESLNGYPFESPCVVGEGANHCTRGGVRSPFQSNSYLEEEVVARRSQIYSPPGLWHLRVNDPSRISKIKHLQDGRSAVLPQGHI